MKLMLYSWNANNEQILADNLIKSGFEVVWFHKECRHYTRDMELAMEMMQQIHGQRVEAVVSFNYFPIISMVCHTCQIPYYAWVYDCPHFTLYAKQMNYGCNHIGIFDKEMVRQLRNYGISTVFHVPLSVDTEFFGQVIDHASPREREKYRCDVSFVGSLYTDEHNYYDLLFSNNRDGESRENTGGPDYDSIVMNTGHIDDNEHAVGIGVRETSGCYGDCGSEEKVPDGNCMDAVIQRQLFSYCKDYIRQAVRTGQIDLYALQAGMEKQGLMLGEDYFARSEDILIPAVLEKKVTVEERRALLAEIAGKIGASFSDRSVGNDRSKESEKNADDKYDFRLYTGSDTKALPELHTCNYGRVDYHTQMPLVFAGSRINLNISLRSIHSGIPLRVLDIMACGGFVLSNWQPEIAEYFEEGVEIVTFSGLDDCMDKVRYYLTHEEERRKIAAAGQRKVGEVFSYEAGLEKLFGN